MSGNAYDQNFLMECHRNIQLSMETQLLRKEMMVDL